MASLDELEPEAPDAGPLLADAAVASGSTGSLWRRLTHAVDETLLPTRAVTALRRFRDLILTLSDIASREPVSDVLGTLLDQSGYSGTSASGTPRKPKDVWPT